MGTGCLEELGSLRTLLFGVSGKGDRQKGYIEDSTSLPDIDTSCETLSKAIPSKEVHALFYCNGVNCRRSANALKVALSCGYSKLYWFRGGFEEWVRKGFPYVND